MPLGLKTTASVTDSAIHKKMFGPGTTKLTISNKEVNCIKKIVKPCLLIKVVSKTI